MDKTLLEQAIRALYIFHKHDSKADLAAEHDEIFVSGKLENLTEQEITELGELGWYQWDGINCWRRYV